MNIVRRLLVAAVLTGVVSCTTMTPEQQGTLSGAAIGAAAGAGIAAIADGDAGVGAVAGGLLGGVVGNMKARKQQESPNQSY